jgi:hypothetical protein
LLYDLRGRNGDTATNKNGNLEMMGIKSLETLRQMKDASGSLLA